MLRPIKGFTALFVTTVLKYRPANRSKSTFLESQSYILQHTKTTFGVQLHCDFLEFSLHSEKHDTPFWVHNGSFDKIKNKELYTLGI